MNAAKPAAPKPAPEAEGEEPNEEAETEQTAPEAEGEVSTLGNQSGIAEEDAASFTETVAKFATVAEAEAPANPLFAEVSGELDRQFEQWGEQNHPNGTGGAYWTAAANAAKSATDRAVKQNAVTWTQILDEEMKEAFAEENPARIREELIQVAAVALQWAAAIDRRAA